LLKLNWSDLTYEKKKLFFKNNEAVFLQKKQLLIHNAKITDKMKALHEKMKLITDNEIRSDIAKELLELDNQKFNNWRQIDAF